MKIKIVTKRPGGEKLRGVGLGNQIAMIPAIKHLRKKGHLVYTDSDFLHCIGACPSTGGVGYARYEYMIPDRIYVPAYPNWKDVFEIRMANLFIDVRGFKYRVKGRKVGIGYSKSYPVHEDMSEHLSVREMIPNDEKFHLDGHQPIKNFVIFGTSNKEKCRYKCWNDLRHKFLNLGYDVHMIGEYGRMYKSYKSLFHILRKAELYVGVDSGMMHLADILGIPGFVFWGDTNYRRCGPVSNMGHVQGLETKLTKLQIAELLDR